MLKCKLQYGKRKTYPYRSHVLILHSIITFKLATLTVEDIQAIVSKLKGVTEDIKWENHLCFNVGGKMFIVTAPDHVPVSASFKVSDEAFEELPQHEGFIPAPYLARYKWIFVDDINRLSKKQWERYIKEAHSLVAAKLPAKARGAIGL